MAYKSQFVRQIAGISVSDQIEPLECRYRSSKVVRDALTRSLRLGHAAQNNACHSLLSAGRNWSAKMVRRSGVYGLFLILACCGLLACTQVDQAGGETMIFFESPEGATAPEGVSAIEKGMSQDEVLRILTPLYAVQHAADAEPSSPIVDYFTYNEGGKTKYVEIFYDGEKVYGVRFGYTDTLVIE